MRDASKARGVEHTGVFERRATPLAAMQRRALRTRRRPAPALVLQGEDLMTRRRNAFRQRGPSVLALEFAQRELDGARIGHQHT